MMAGNGWNGLIWLETAGMVEHDWIWLKMAGNGQKLLEKPGNSRKWLILFFKISGNGLNGRKWLAMAGNGLKWLKTAGMAGHSWK